MPPKGGVNRAPYRVGEKVWGRRGERSEKRLTAAAFCEAGDMAGELKAAGCSDILRKDELKV